MKTFLPDLNSPEGKELVSNYPTASVRQIVEWTKKYGYKNKRSFMNSVHDRYGLERILAGEGWEPSKLNIPLTLDTTKELRTFVFWCDSHNPYHDEKTITLVERFLLDTQFHYLIYGGDVNDFYGLSDFDKNPMRIANMQADVDSTKQMFERHSKLFPNVERILLEGNHEDRLRRFLWTKASELSSLSCLSVPELFKLEDFGIGHIPYEQGLKVNGVFLFLHGTFASIHSGFTAKWHFERNGGCGICGHCHRGGSHLKRNRFGDWGWWEGFCLCHLNPDWIKNPNWMQGLSLVHFIGKRFFMEQIPIIDHSLMYGGRLYQ